MHHTTFVAVHPEFESYDDMVEEYAINHDYNFEHDFLFKDKLDRLSDDAKSVIDIIFNAPMELLEIVEGEGGGNLRAESLLKFLQDIPWAFADLEARNGAWVGSPWGHRFSRRVVKEIQIAVTS